MGIPGRISRLAGVVLIWTALLAPSQGAFASVEGRDTLLGAGIGAVAGGLLGHGRAGPIVGGAVAGAVIGNLAGHHRKYYRYGYWRPYRYAYWRPYYRHYYWHAYWRPYRYAYWGVHHWRYRRYYAGWYPHYWRYARRREWIYVG